MVQNDKKKKKKREGSDAVITLDRVSKSYSSGSPALDNVSLTIKKGEFVFIVGDSGSGKSTLIKLLLRELTPTSGRVIVNGADVARLKRRQVPKFRRNLGIVFQDFRLLNDRNVYENVAFAQRVIQMPTKLMRKNVPNALAEVGLAGKYKAKTKQLSGGEQQRVALARALVNEPPILLADEPTGNLDPKNSWEIMKLLERINEERGTTILVVTHNREIVNEMKKRVITMMRISTFFYTLKQGVINIFRNKLFSLASIATISACLFLFGLFYAVILNFQNVVRTAEEDVSVTVFFKDGTTQEEMEQIGAQIRARDEVSEAKFISADEAWAEWAPENIGEDYNEIYTENPLEGMDNYEIYMNDVSKQESLVSWLESIPQVERVRYSEVAATTLTGVNALVAYTSVGIIAILLAVSVFLINNTVMIGISVRKSEIEIMKYIGATDFFVRSPFVIEGILIGLIGSLLPLGLIYVLYKKVIDYVMIEFPSLSGLMQFLPVSEIYRTLLPVCLGLGAGIGFLGSFITVRKHLRV